MSTIVIGLGNPLLSDDGVGWSVARRLGPLLADREGVTVDVSCRGGLSLMEQLLGYDRAIIVDAIRTGGEPGTIYQLVPEELPTKNAASAHDVDLPTALELGRRLGGNLPSEEDILVLAIEGEDTETFCEECTPSVARAVPRALEAVIGKLVPNGGLDDLT